MDTFIGEYPSMINYNNTAIVNYIHTFYDPSGGNVGFIKIPVNTTGNVRATSGIFGNLISQNLTVSSASGGSGNLTVQGNLTVIGTTQINNVTTLDLAYVTAYNGAPYHTRDASYSWEPIGWGYIDVSTSYYKIRNDASIALNCLTLGQIVSFIFDTSYGTLDNPFDIRLDPSNNIFRILTDSSISKLSLICTYIDSSASNSIWKVYDYAVWNGMINNF